LPRRAVANALGYDLLRPLLPTDIGYFPKAAGHFMKRTDGIDQAVFIYCVKGQGWCEMEDSPHVIEAGDVLAIPRAAPMRMARMNSGLGPFFGCISRATPFRPSWENWGPRQPTRLAPGGKPELLALFEELLDVVEHGYAASRLLYASQILAHLIGLMIWDRRRNWRGPLDTAQKVVESINYMKQHLDQHATAASFAALANLSESHYRSLFKRQIGYAPMDYFIRLRMHKACQLLDTTTLNVKEIATLVGYEDPLYFSRVFKAVVELTPTQYRLVNKG